MTTTIIQSDARHLPLTDKSVNCCVTSPPYFGLRDYGTAKWEGGSAECDHARPRLGGNGPLSLINGGGSDRDESARLQQYRDTCAKCGATRIDAQIGLEPTPAAYVEEMVKVFREVRRVLRDDGTLWLNLGDSYATGTTTDRKQSKNPGVGNNRPEAQNSVGRIGTPAGLKTKDLIGIPWMVAFALRADGWYLRQDIIWCLSGGTVLYARTQKGDMPATIKDLSRLDPSTVKLWNGEKWTQVLGWSKARRNADELELVLRSGERISCTPNHQFPTNRGLLRADEIIVGDKMIRVALPEPDAPKSPAHIGDDAAWFAGLYLAEGSMSEDTIQLAGNAAEGERLARVRAIAEAYGGSATCTIEGNKQSIRVYGKVLLAILKELVSGKTAKDKGFASVCWRYGNGFLRSMLDGYLSGDGHWDENNKRWRLGFTRNYNLERDLRVLAARLGFNLTLNPVLAVGFKKEWPAFKGEIRFERSGHRNEKDTAEVVEIRRSRCRYVYDVGVEDEPHLFAIASGILTHNSKPNPMPESVTDRCTKAHEYIFLLSKSAKYYYDAQAIQEDATSKAGGRSFGKQHGIAAARGARAQSRRYDRPIYTKRNRRSVWTVATKSYKGAHFATFPMKLIEPCILAGCPVGGTVLDPFAGSGTTLRVAADNGRNAIGIELNPDYIELAHKRLAEVATKKPTRTRRRMDEVQLRLLPEAGAA